MPANIIARESGGDESQLRSRSVRIAEGLSQLGMTHVVGVPDNATRILYTLLDADPKVQVIPVCREGEAWAIASGLWVGGKTPVVIIQNTGFLESGDALRGTAIAMGVPLLALINYRGYHTLLQPDEDAVDSVASFFEPTLRAWQMPYEFLEEGKEVEILVSAAEKARAAQGPVVVLMI